MSITMHALTRMAQRNIPPLMVDLLYRYGREQAQNGGTVLYLDDRGRQHAHEALSEILRRFDKLATSYLVEAGDSGAVVTLGYKRKRFRRK